MLARRGGKKMQEIPDAIFLHFLAARRPYALAMSETRDAPDPGEAIRRERERRVLEVLDLDDPAVRRLLGALARVLRGLPEPADARETAERRLPI